MLKTELIQFSCVLSMLGSCLVVFTWAYPAENRSKPGRVLLLWVSVADFFSSLFYFIQTFPAVTEQAEICQALALLDIFFPVASFLWTDFVAFYLYLVVHCRGVDFVLAWDKLLRVFHLVAWSLSLLVVLLVLLTHHAGNNASDDDANADNTAGWCWISAEDKEQRFLWELVGGKCVEWVSGLVVVPFFYVSVARKLYRIDQGARPVSDRAVVQNVPSFAGAQRTTSGGAIADNKSEHGLTLTLPRTTSTIPSDTAYPPLTAISIGSDKQNNSSANSSMQSSVRMAYEDSDRGQTSSFSTVSIEGRMRNDNSYNEDDDGDDERSQRHSVQYFNRFYLKLFLLPLVFIFIRFWSSLRIVLAFAGEDKTANNGFLVVMQAFFDPSQGFFNSLLFVFFSKTDRNRLLRSLRRCLPWSNAQEENPSRANKTSKFASSSIAPLQHKNKRDSDESEIEIEDLENDFECDMKDRLSDFSFDSRLDTAAVNPMSHSISFKM